MYPVKKKDYQSDPAIAGHWRTIQGALKAAWIVTFFGYGAPQTDVEAIELLKKGWGEVGDRRFEETEIINTAPKDELGKKWSPFIHTHHFRIQTSFYDSYIARHPRRSCEALWACLMECRFLEGSEIPVNASFDQLYDWFSPRLREETR